MCDCDLCNCEGLFSQYSNNHNHVDYDYKSNKNKKSKNKKFFILAKITDKRGHVLSIGWNSYVKTHPMQARMAKRSRSPLKEFLHAEMMAIIRLLPQHRSKAYSITVYRFDANGRPALAKPCPICMSAIRAAGIKRVYYTDYNNSQDLDYDEYRQYHHDCKSWC